MEYEKISKPPVTINRYEGNFIIKVPAKRAMLSAAITGFLVGMFALGTWLAINWIAQEIIAIIDKWDEGLGDIFLHLASLIFILVWLTLWTTAGINTLKKMLWSLWGEESIIIDEKLLTIAKNYKFFRQKKSFLADEVKRLRFDKSEATSKNRFSDLMGNYSGYLAFDYGAKTIKFVNTDEQAIAYEVLEEITKVKPQWR